VDAEATETVEWFVNDGSERTFRLSVLPKDRSKVIARLAIVHGYGDHAGRYLEAMTWFASQGVSCHAVDLRGHGRSTGRRGYVRRWDDYLLDLENFLRHPDVAERDEIPLFILGHSHGGLVVAVAGVRHLLERHNAAGVILSAPYLENAFPVPRHKSIAARFLTVLCPSVRISSGLKPELMSSDPERVEDSRNDPLMLRCATPRWFMGQLAAREEAMTRASEFTLPLLMLQGDADSIADPRGARKFVERAASRDKTIIEYPGFRHEVLREVGRQRVFGDVMKWIHARP
jgi:alpha-beta hydrolase superfamily lysophospholipase